MMLQLIVWFVLLTSCGRLSSNIRHVERGKKALLFGNETNTGKVVSLYVNGKKNNTFIVKWTVENTTITADWMPDFRANYGRIFMDPMKNIWIADFDEHYEGTYSILGSPSAVVELIVLACARNKYGPSCEYSCQCKEDNTIQCDSKTGHCLCKPGWQGICCSEPCPFSYYGENCSKACICFNNGNCNHITGQCECQAGYKGDRCGDRCDEGTFGFNCQGKCKCETGAACEPQSGNCISTPGNSHQLDKIAEYMVVLIAMFSAAFFIIILYMIIKIIRKNWKKCCKPQENIEEGPPSIEEQGRAGSHVSTLQNVDSTTVKESGRTDPVPPREPNALDSINASGETTSLLSENPASDSASNTPSVETNPCSPREDAHLLPRSLPTPMNIPGTEADFRRTAQGKKKIHIRETKF